MADSPFDPRRLRQARALLAPSPRSDGLGLAVAAALFVVSALTLIATVVATRTPGAT